MLPFKEVRVMMLILGNFGYALIRRDHSSRCTAAANVAFHGSQSLGKSRVSVGNSSVRLGAMGPYKQALLECVVLSLPNKRSIRYQSIPRRIQLLATTRGNGIILKDVSEPLLSADLHFDNV